jgi:GTP cyclohydrolase I
VSQINKPLVLDDHRDSAGEESIAALMRRIIELLGEDPNREGLKNTPERFEKAMRFLTKGYGQDPEKVLNGAMFNVCYDQMVVVKDIEMYSLVRAPHAAVFRQMPRGLSSEQKSRGPLENSASRKSLFAPLQIQERLTNQIAQAIEKAIAPLGVGVVIEARHMCMVMRGVEKQNSQAVTSAMLGSFRDNQQTREEFLSLIARK